MTDNPKAAKGLRSLQKSFSQPAEDLLIRAQVARADGKGYQSVGFMRERIDYLADLSDETGTLSGIALKTGAHIVVDMPYEKLEQSIYFADLSAGGVLDLREKTGAVTATKPMPDLAHDFAAALPKAEAKRPLEDVPLKIALFARQSQEQNFRMFIFEEEQIDWETVEGINGKNGKATKFTLDWGDSPFGDDEVIFDMPRPKFMELYNLAKMNGEAELDLREWTRRIDPDNTPPPAGVSKLTGRNGPQPGY